VYVAELLSTLAIQSGQSKLVHEENMSDTPNDKKKNAAQADQATVVDLEKRNFLIATSSVGALGCAAAAVPFVLSMTPSERAKAAGAPVEVDVSKIAPGSMMTVEWRGKPVWIINRTEEMTAELPKHDDQLTDPSCDVVS
jgi:ubiquinol-cytochrome c reductase iron-sulfur subunit